jgi:hypothetical protein
MQQKCFWQLKLHNNLFDTVSLPFGHLRLVGWSGTISFGKLMQNPSFFPFWETDVKSLIIFQGPHFFDRRQRLGTVRITQMRNINGTGECLPTSIVYCFPCLIYLINSSRFLL